MPGFSPGPERFWSAPSTSLVNSASASWRIKASPVPELTERLSGLTFGPILISTRREKSKRLPTLNPRLLHAPQAPSRKSLRDGSDLRVD